MGHSPPMGSAGPGTCSFWGTTSRTARPVWGPGPQLALGAPGNPRQPGQSRARRRASEVPGEEARPRDVSGEASRGDPGPAVPGADPPQVHAPRAPREDASLPTRGGEGPASTSERQRELPKDGLPGAPSSGPRDSEPESPVTERSELPALGGPGPEAAGSASQAAGALLPAADPPQAAPLAGGLGTAESRAGQGPPGPQQEPGAREAGSQRGAACPGDAGESEAVEAWPPGQGVGTTQETSGNTAGAPPRGPDSGAPGGAVRCLPAPAPARPGLTPTWDAPEREAGGEPQDGAPQPALTHGRRWTQRTRTVSDVAHPGGAGYGSPSSGPAPGAGSCPCPRCEASHTELPSASTVGTPGPGGHSLCQHVDTPSASTVDTPAARVDTPSASTVDTPMAQVDTPLPHGGHSHGPGGHSLCQHRGHSRPGGHSHGPGGHPAAQVDTPMARWTLPCQYRGHSHGPGGHSPAHVDTPTARWTLPRPEPWTLPRPRWTLPCQQWTLPGPGGHPTAQGTPHGPGGHFHGPGDTPSASTWALPWPRGTLHGPGGHARGPGGHSHGPGDTPLAQVDMPAAQVDTPMAQVDTPTAQVDMPAAQVDTPMAQVDTPTAQVDMPAAQVDTPTAQVDMPAAQVGHSHGPGGHARGPGGHSHGPGGHPRPRWTCPGPGGHSPAQVDMPAAQVGTPRPRWTLPWPRLFPAQSGSCPRGPRRRLPGTPLTCISMAPPGKGQKPVRAGKALVPRWSPCLPREMPPPPPGRWLPAPSPPSRRPGRPVALSLWPGPPWGLGTPCPTWTARRPRPVASRGRGRRTQLLEPAPGPPRSLRALAVSGARSAAGTGRGGLPRTPAGAPRARWTPAPGRAAPTGFPDFREHITKIFETSVRGALADRPQRAPAPGEKAGAPRSVGGKDLDGLLSPGKLPDGTPAPPAGLRVDAKKQEQAVAVEAEASHPVPQDPAPEQPPRRAGPGLGQDPPGARAGEVVAGRPPVPRDSGQPEGGSGRQEAASGPSSREAPVEKAAGAQAAARSHGEGASDPDDRIPSGEQHRPRAEGAWGPALPAAPGDVPSSTSALGAPSPRGDALTGARPPLSPAWRVRGVEVLLGSRKTQKPAAAGDTPPGPGLAAGVPSL
ncbi:hypothetical protein QTO34_005715 [Cnephaeus nilssonii]|uniref:Uncharacterized protein n=1 Tax=Cnephaeus nilssonii TaxID=3371016 RepID=A0AA40LIC1_CNENI|nr:hypothetical protein QTO34_005715 [Eptesicus nilssonii]